MKKPNKAIVDLFFELGMQKKIEHAGLKFAGVKHPDTLGEHTCRVAQIGYVLALAERANPERVAALCLMHDIGEIRIGDFHRIASRYLKPIEAERKAVFEQTEDLPKIYKKHIRELWTEFHDQKTLESQLARDADLLETILQAKEYLDNGCKAASRWLSNGSKHLKSKTAKSLFDEILKTGFADWWDYLN